MHVVGQATEAVSKSLAVLSFEYFCSSNVI